MKTLLVPLDFSSSTEAIMKEAALVAQAFPARVVLLHVVEPVATYVPVGASMDVIAASPLPPTQTENLDVYEQRLQTIAKPLIASGLEVTTSAVVGLAVDDILEEAVKLKADYIVLGSHGHGALYHLFSGSVVTGVLKRAVCPVLVVPVKK